MAVLELFQHMVPYLGELTSWQGFAHHFAHQSLVWHSTIDWSVFAALLDTDVFKPVRVFFDYFIKSGQVWALLIGSIVGYLFRTLTSYG